MLLAALDTEGIFFRSQTKAGDMIIEIAAAVQMGGHVQHADLRNRTQVTFTERYVKL